MATTYRQVLNRVLTVLSEDLVDSGATELQSDYHKLVGEFVNQFKEEVEDAHNWRALRSTIAVTVTADTNSATITGANERSRLLRVYDEIRGDERALVFDVTESNNPYQLHEMDLSELLRRRELDTSNGNDPVAFAIDNTGEDVMTLQVWPTPTDERTINVTMIVPQDFLDVDDLDVNVKVPHLAIVRGALWYALEERGEELGTRAIFNESSDSGIPRYERN